MRRELAEDFRLLRTVKNGNAIRTLAYLERLSFEQQLELFQAQLKAFHPIAAAILGEELTHEEKLLLEKKSDALLQPFPLELEMAGEPFGEKRIPRMNRRLFARLARKELEARLEPPVEKRRQGGWFTVAICGWKVSTDVSYGSPPYYFHHIGKGQTERLVEHVSFLSWLGISSQTTWELAREGAELQTAQSLATLCSHFLDAVPALLSDLCC